MVEPVALLAVRLLAALHGLDVLLERDEELLDRLCVGLLARAGFEEQPAEVGELLLDEGDLGWGCRRTSWVGRSTVNG